MRIPQAQVSRIFDLVTQGHTFSHACVVVGVKARVLRHWIRASKAGSYRDNHALYLQYERACIPCCDLCNAPIPSPSRRIREDSGEQVRYQLVFCSTECQQQWHQEENES